ncbi:uncharacterized protein BJX67DRAFT_370567 [Aspergillus lucknowensis]|uniref:Uncharacterized protein n=1 Tax=Aspergillus lucknowensis TaxID=176173 RepID=A0ABR4LYU6_9EURO
MIGRLWGAKPCNLCLNHLGWPMGNCRVLKTGKFPIFPRNLDTVSLSLLALSLWPALSQAQEVVTASAFNLSELTLGDGRFLDNQDRTLAYLKFVDVEKLLYNFRANHQLDTQGAEANGGWDAPDFPFRTHVQGHFLSAWAQCYATLGDADCQDRATYFVSELAKCQANNEAAGFTTGYLSGFPESDFDALEAGSLSNGNVPYYNIHKTLAGLLAVWRLVGDATARDVLLSLAGWVDTRTSALSEEQMQAVLGTEFGGMNDVLADLYQETSDDKWLATAQRFDHAAVFDPLADNVDELNGLHANTQVPKWIGAVREYKATGDTRYLDIARNAWTLTINSHTYAIGGNSQAEHFHEPNAIAAYLDEDTAEACNSYNMLKLTRELWTLDPENTAYFDFYENALLNHLLGQQNPADEHGHITYFTSLNPGGRRGVGPAWGGGTWRTALETNTKLMDSIYFYSDNALYVNQFIPSAVTWSDMGVTVTQTTTFPVGDTTTLDVDGTGDWELHIRIPSWTSNAVIKVNGKQVTDVDASPGSYAVVSRTWAAGDKVDIQLPMHLRKVPANDDPSIAAVAYGPVVLCGNYGDAALSATPSLALDSVVRAGNSSLEFSGVADGADVTLGPLFDGQGFNYVTYWTTTGDFM